MPIPPAPATPARSLAAVNADIRALWARGGRLSPEGRREYERLLAEWAAVVRGDAAEAA
ncbi:MULTISPECIES: hypothetical protein [unclassified Streptomyces]|uniref:hypothetical protein n=1 Tax=unclassified Streptomyces TaxID=2593676 RepID=UPI0022532CAD|nr:MULTISPECIES: hypothetical protein [unclassified Streptomyces]MCX5139900.1 hypothetical protein [Streptomyces sp. NBC_00338]WRZ64548.1 hypothetical protein OG408_11885 [Streptomyces sp. NBC_01257]WSU58511.1 hypothetical protein OG450_11850 [Streptomyces sp. NBC_01104]